MPILAPSITVQRYPRRSRQQVSALAETTLSTMRRSEEAYPHVVLRWNEDDADSDRITRCYDFTLPGTRPQVRQVQGLVAGEGLFVVNCTEAADAPRLEKAFVEVIESVSG